MALPKFSRNFGGAIFLSQWLKQNFGQISTSVRAQVSPELVDCASNVAGKAVKFYWVPELKSISICLTGTGDPIILIPESFNRCHRRFALCKELCHVLTDDQSVWAQTPSEQLDLAIICSEIVRKGTAKFFASDLTSEAFCFLLAMEIMLPESKRDEILARMGAGESAFDVAFSLQIPESLIKFYKESNYNSFYKLQLQAMKT